MVKEKTMTKVKTTLKRIRKTYDQNGQREEKGSRC